MVEIHKPRVDSSRPVSAISGHLRDGLPDESNRPFAALQGRTDEKGRKGEKAGLG
jgi:hypothetical protein